MRTPVRKVLLDTLLALKEIAREEPSTSSPFADPRSIVEVASETEAPPRGPSDGRWRTNSIR